MFFKEEPKKCPDPFEDKIACTSCNCYLLRAYAKNVSYSNVSGNSYINSWTSHYCGKCAPNYEEVEVDIVANKRKYFKMFKLEVDENGEMVGYKKIEDKK